MPLFVPWFAEASTATIEIDGVTYRVPLIDSAGHLQVDVLTSALPAGAATLAEQQTQTTALRLIDDLRGALAAVAADQLRVDVISSALPTGAATSARQDTMITALQLIDDLRAALDSVQTDRLNVNVFADGASEVKSALKQIGFFSDSRETVATPTSGKKIRLISVQLLTKDTTAEPMQVYFGTGASITTNAGKEIMYTLTNVVDAPSPSMVWPDGAGPVGAVDDVVSFRTNVDISSDLWIVIHYREE